MFWVGVGKGSGERIKYYNLFSNHSFPFFYYHKIKLHVGISTFEQLFYLCFLKYESFSNCQQSYYRNIGYFGGIYTCENVTFHLHSEKRCKRSKYDKGRFWPNLRNCLYRYNIKHNHWKVRIFFNDFTLSFVA